MLQFFLFEYLIFGDAPSFLEISYNLLQFLVVTKHRINNLNILRVLSEKHSEELESIFNLVGNLLYG